MSIEAVLPHVPLFKTLSHAQITTLIGLGQSQLCRAQHIVFNEGDVSGAMYVILSGSVRIFKTDVNGTEINMVEMEAGDYFGEFAMLDGKERSASAMCRTDSELFVLTKQHFMKMIVESGSPELISNVLTELIGRVRRTSKLAFEKALAEKSLQFEMEVERHRSIAELVAGVAHELNTPLGVARTGASLLSNRISSDELLDVVHDSFEAGLVLEDMQDAIVLIDRNVQRAHSLVENFKRISVDHVVDDCQTANLSALVEEVIHLFKIDKRHRALEVTLDDALDASQHTWRGYPGRLTQILTNLLFNVARHAYPEKTGGRVDVRLRSDDDASTPVFILEVQDHGRGIAPALLTKIFDPFFTTRRGEGGTGLGLTITRSLVSDGLKGTIDVTSTKGEGTSFRVIFPRQLS